MSPSLPVELWRQIMLDVDGHQELLALATTCHILSSIARIHIYEKVKISKIPRPQAMKVFPNRRLVQFARSLADRSDLAMLVHSLELHSEGVFHAPMKMEAYSTGKNPIFLQLVSFSQLRKLKICGYHIDQGCYAAIHALPCLKRLTLGYCTVGPIHAHTNTRTNVGNAVLELTIMFPQTTSEWAAFVPLGLRSLTIGIFHRAFFDESPCGADMISNIILRGVNKSLTTLVWAHPYITPAVIDLLNCSPAIRYLSLLHTGAYRPSEHVEALSVDAITKLTHFLGPAEYARAFIQDRPVRSVVMAIAYSTPLEVFDSLQFSSVTVTDLEIRQRDASTFLPSIAYILQHLPQTLHHFISNEYIREEHFPAWLHAISHLLDLRVLELADCLQSLREDFVQALSNKCSSLQEVVFGSSEPWIKRNNGPWERHFRFKSPSS